MQEYLREHPSLSPGPGADWRAQDVLQVSHQGSTGIQAGDLQSQQLLTICLRLLAFQELAAVRCLPRQPKLEIAF